MLFLFLLAFVDRFAAICLCLLMHTLDVMHTLAVMFPKVYTYTYCFVCLHIEEKFNKINILLDDVLNIKGHSQFFTLNIPKVDNVSTIFLLKKNNQVTNMETVPFDQYLEQCTF